MEGTSDGNGDWEGWGHYMRVKQQKLAAQFVHEQGRNDTLVTEIFKGIAIFVNGFTDPSADDLRRLMQSHGGEFHMYQLDTTTHIIASNLPHAKQVKLKGGEKIVRPEWITDSVRAGKLLPDTNYLLYNSTNDQNNLQRWTKPAPVSKEIPKTSDPQFLSEFYAHSRLHFIATLGQHLKDYVRKLKAEGDSVRIGTARLDAFLEKSRTDGTLTGSDLPTLTMGEKVFMHLDMDCFFVSVGLRTKPELRGLPVVVTHSKGKGPGDRAEGSGGFSSRAEIASCSYEARKFGLKNGMYLGPAIKKCPNLKTIPYDFEGYETVSKQLYDIVTSYTLLVEAVSCDEMYVDLTDICTQRPGIHPLDVALVIRQHLWEVVQCPASAGLGPTMLIARLATKRAKPNGQFYVPQRDVLEFISSQPITDIPGVGHATLEKMEGLNVSTCADLQKVPLKQLQAELGIKQGQQLFNQCRGIDVREIRSEPSVRKSVSCDVNYGIRMKEESEALKFVTDLAAEVASRLREAGLKGQSITLKLLIRAQDAPVETPKFLGCGVCDAATKTAQLLSATSDAKLLASECCSLFKQIKPSISDLRGVGISVHKLVAEGVSNVDRRQKTLSEMVGRRRPENILPHRITTKANPITDETSSSSGQFAVPRTVINPIAKAAKANPITDEASSSSGQSAVPRTVINPIAKAAQPSASTSRSLCDGDDSGFSALPMPEQIDPEFLAALPPGVRWDLQQACRAQNRALPTLPTRNVRSTVQGTSKRSPIKRHSSKRTTKRHPLKRPSLEQEHPTVLDLLLKKPVVQQVSKVDKPQAAVPNNSLVTSPEAEGSSQVNTPSQKTAGNRVLFHGETDYEQIRATLKRWTRVESRPSKRKTDDLLKYLEGRVLARQLDLVLTILRGFRLCIARNCEGQRRSLWMDLWQKLVDSIQLQVVAIYKVPLLFPD